MVWVMGNCCCMAWSLLSDWCRAGHSADDAQVQPLQPPQSPQHEQHGKPRPSQVDAAYAARPDSAVPAQPEQVTHSHLFNPPRVDETSASDLIKLSM